MVFAEGQRQAQAWARGSLPRSFAFASCITSRNMFEIKQYLQTSLSPFSHFQFRIHKPFHKGVRFVPSAVISDLLAEKQGPRFLARGGAAPRHCH